MTPFDPTPADLARIDRARAEAWLTAHGWAPERHSRLLWSRSVGGRVVASVILPPDGAYDAPRRWLETLHTVGHHHGLRWLALSAVVVAWQAPGVEVGS